jgi:hypothetical protein
VTGIGRTLVFVNDVADAGPGATRTVVLDTSWTPAPGDERGLIAIRGVLDPILDSVNLFEESLAMLDAWADACGLADRFTLEDVTWWFHARSFVRLDVQELLLWSRVLDVVAPVGAFETILVPDDRPMLAAAARATPRPPAVRTTSHSLASTSDSTGKPAAKGRPAVIRAIAKGARGVERTAILLGRPLPPRVRALLLGSRTSTLIARVEAIASRPDGVLAIVRAPSFHHVAAGDQTERQDPYVSPVLDRLALDGIPTAIAAIAMHHRWDDDWDAIVADERLLPMSFVNALGPARIDPDHIVERLRTIPEVAMTVDGRDIGPAVRTIVASLGPWLERQHRELLTAERLLTTVRPRAVVTGWEAARTAWLGAARRVGIPSVAIQHGVIYPGTPDYCRPAHRALVRPDVTCVYGPYERRILMDQGGYRADEVAATGSPRIEAVTAPGRESEDERRTVRAELGVADGHRMLVVSGGRMTVGDRLQNVPLLARALDGPLGDVHVVVKLHPEEGDGDHYRSLLVGLAEARGDPAPPVTTIRDVDLYRLLRAADAHLGVYSTVLTDSVLVGTPNMIVVGQAFADLLGYVESGVAVAVRTAADVRAFMLDPKLPAPADRERFIAEHYLDGDAAGRIAGLVEAAVAKRAASGRS